MCFTRQVSLSSDRSSPSPGCVCSSDGTHNRTLPSSPADASISPITVVRLNISGDFVHSMRVRSSYPSDRIEPHSQLVYALPVYSNTILFVPPRCTQVAKARGLRQTGLRRRVKVVGIRGTARTYSNIIVTSHYCQSKTQPSFGEREHLLASGC